MKVQSYKKWEKNIFITIRYQCCKYIQKTLKNSERKMIYQMNYNIFAKTIIIKQDLIKLYKNL